MKQQNTTGIAMNTGMCRNTARAACCLRIPLTRNLRHSNINPNKSRLKDIYRFPDAMEVEICARVCRKWTEDDVLDGDAVKLAETIIKVGGGAGRRCTARYAVELQVY